MRLIALAFAMGLLWGCTHTASVDLNYASTSLGFRNSGALSPGKIFIWDTVENELVDLRSTLNIDIARNIGPTNFEARDVTGFEVNASGRTQTIPYDVEAQIASAVTNSIGFSVTNAIRETNHKIYNAISREYKSLGENGYVWWRVDDLRKSGRYKLVVLVDPTWAEKEYLYVTRARGGSASVKTPTSSGTFEIRFPKDSNASCSTASTRRSVCFIDAVVLDVFVNKNGNLDYQPTLADFDKQLSEALRKL